MHKIQEWSPDKLFGTGRAEQSCTGRVDKSDLAFHLNADQIRGKRVPQVSVRVPLASQCFLHLSGLAPHKAATVLSGQSAHRFRHLWTAPEPWGGSRCSTYHQPMPRAVDTNKTGVDGQNLVSI